MNTDSEKDPNKLTGRDYWLLAGVVIAGLLYTDTHDDVVNYPDFLKYYLWAIAGLAMVLIYFKKIKSKIFSRKSLMDRLFYACVMITILVVGSFFAAGAALAPFNYCNKYIAIHADAEVADCSVDSADIGAYIGRDNVFNYIYYHFQGKPNIIRTELGTFDIGQIHALHTFSQYKLVLITHKALLGSYWLQDWKIELVHKEPSKSVK